MAQAAKLAKGSSTYAIAQDFCRVFAEEMNGLYVLSFLLTANRGSAERCFTQALDDCYKSTTVFKDWAHSWARRMIIQNAMRLVQPRTEAAPYGAVAFDTGAQADAHVPLPAILQLSNFERFVFVLTVLERYSDQECKTLLECSRQDLVQARSRALRQIGEWGKSQLPVAAPAQREMLACAS